MAYFLDPPSILGLEMNYLINKLVRTAHFTPKTMASDKPPLPNSYEKTKGVGGAAATIEFLPFLLISIVLLFFLGLNFTQRVIRDYPP